MLYKYDNIKHLETHEKEERAFANFRLFWSEGKFLWKNGKGNVK